MVPSDWIDVYVRVVLDSVSVTYQAASGRDLVAVRDVNLEIRDGEFVTIIGPSGCGKSTLLFCMGGMLRPTSGQVLLDGEPIARPAPRRAAFVFQDYGLFPWKSVIDNAAMGLRFLHVSKAERRKTASRYLDMVGLRDFHSAYPAELSGGMQQRVAVARALAMEPEILLLDEPFGAVDEFSRRALGIEMSRLLTESGKSAVLITHSLEEAIFWGDRVVVMASAPGRIVEEIVIDSPRPRQLPFTSTTEFQELRARLLALLTSLGHVAEPSGAGADEQRLPR